MNYSHFWGGEFCIIRHLLYKNNLKLKNLKLFSSKGDRDKGPCEKKKKNQRSSIFVCHHYSEAASERRYCCSVEHTRPSLRCCARILKQARVIIRPQTIQLTRLCHSIHFSPSHAPQPARDPTQLGCFTDKHSASNKDPGVYIQRWFLSHLFFIKNLTLLAL